ncbi:MAG: hypothetical protein AB8H47_30255 [Bacteroidia bacterium]
MAKQYNLVISEEAAEDIEAIRDFGEARQKRLGFKYLEDILDCIDLFNTTHNLSNTTKLLQWESAED